MGLRVRCARAVVALAIAFGSARGAAAEVVLFDFEELAPTSLPSFGVGSLSSLVSDRRGLTLTVIRSPGGVFDLCLMGTEVYPSGFGQAALDPFHTETFDDWFVGTFSAPVTSVSLQATDFFQDQDEVELYAYAGPIATGDFVASDLEFWPQTASSPDFVTVSVTAGETPIESIRFRGGSPTAYPNSMFIDNIAVTPVPEPGGGALAAVCALGACALRSRGAGSPRVRSGRETPIFD